MQYVPVESVLGAALGFLVARFIVELLERAAAWRRERKVAAALAELLAEREDSE